MEDGAFAGSRNEGRSRDRRTVAGRPSRAFGGTRSDGAGLSLLIRRGRGRDVARARLPGTRGGHAPSQILLSPSLQLRSRHGSVEGRLQRVITALHLTHDRGVVLVISTVWPCRGGPWRLLRGIVDELIMRLTRVPAFPACSSRYAVRGGPNASLGTTVIAIAIPGPWYTPARSRAGRCGCGRPFVESAPGLGIPHRTDPFLRPHLPNHTTGSSRSPRRGWRDPDGVGVAFMGSVRGHTRTGGSR